MIIKYAIIILIIILAIAFGSSQFTGQAIGNLSQESSSFISATLIIISLILAFFLVGRKTDDEEEIE